MNKSAEINELAAALAKAQGEMKAAKENAKNPFFKSSYADLNSVWKACQEVLPKYGLAVLQIPNYSDIFTLETMITHSSGQWISGSYLIKPQKEDPQGYGSAISYARRYSLEAMLSIVTEDDDGEEAMNRSKPDPVIKKHFGNIEGVPFVTEVRPASQRSTPPTPNHSPVIAGGNSSSGIDAHAQATKLFWLTARGAGWTDDDVKDFIVAKFKIQTTKEMTPGQLTESTKHFDSHPWDK